MITIIYQPILAIEHQWKCKFLQQMLFSRVNLIWQVTITKITAIVTIKYWNNRDMNSKFFYNANKFSLIKSSTMISSSILSLFSFFWLGEGAGKKRSKVSLNHTKNATKPSTYLKKCLMKYVNPLEILNRYTKHQMINHQSCDHISTPLISRTKSLNK